MRLESALHTSREGLDAHGKAISVIGDNISNSNTIGYKTSRVEFADLLPAAEAGSDNPSMPTGGAGVSLQKVRQLQEAGVIEDTGRALDVAIDGNGYLLLNDPTNPFLSKAGNLQIDEEGFLVSSAGYQVLGFSGENGTTLGAINMAAVDLAGNATTECDITGNISSMDAISQPPDNPETFNDLGKAAGFSTTLDFYDSLGTPQPIRLYCFKTEASKWTIQAYVDGAQVGQDEGKPVKGGEVNLTFSEMGIIPEGNQANAQINFQAAFAGAAQGNVAIDLSKLTQYASEPNIAILSLDGVRAGSVQEYRVERDGRLVAVLDSGTTAMIGTLQLGTVPNVDGLERAGNGQFFIGTTAGTLATGQPGSTGFGKMVGYALERSAVDISTEFVNLTLYQRGYQANSQILTATNNLIRDTINMMR